MDPHELLSNQSMSNRKDSSAKKASFLNWHLEQREKISK